MICYDFTEFEFRFSDKRTGARRPSTPGHRVFARIIRRGSDPFARAYARHVHNEGVARNAQFERKTTPNIVQYTTSGLEREQDLPPAPLTELPPSLVFGFFKLPSVSKQFFPIFRSTKRINHARLICHICYFRSPEVLRNCVR